MVYTLQHQDPYANNPHPSDSEMESYSSDLDQSEFRSARRTANRNTTLCTPRSLGTEIVHSSVGLAARRAHGRERGGWGRRGGRLVGGDIGRGITWGRRGRRGRHDRQGGTLVQQDSGDGIWGIRWGRQGTRGTLGGRLVEGDNVGGIWGIRWGRRGTRSRPSQMSEERSCKKTILSWLIHCKCINEDELVGYMDGTKKTATMTGRITRGAILCSCCKRERSVWNFEKHVGSDLGRPYEHIYLFSKDKCLQYYQIAACLNARELERQCMFSFVPKETDADPNDDVCLICGDGGDLICCDTCPSTYHPSCMNMELVCYSESEWYCPYCTCKYCGLVEESKPLDTCSQCDKKFHRQCFKESGKEFSNNFSRFYCSSGCKEIHETLEGSLGIRNDLFASYSWRVIRQSDIIPEVVSATRNQQLENNSKVAVAWMLMNEAFQTITDRYTGIDVVQSVVYSRGSDITRINFSRFYTFVLEKDDEIIAAACIRFQGRRIAEMPFVATDEAYRRQGICKVLMSAVESFLCNLKIENLIIPSVPDISEMWMHKYGFGELNEELQSEITSCNILMFPGCLRLYKNLSTCMTDGDNDREAQMDQTERPLLDLNEEPPPED
ncbi:PREDICTED: increased DNA methylation 1-like isoform X2 [Lupinus angustifolius]|nr:PREDICTED: increased DNA methylation 1-like isoform X2 [Lupinus angustifolius]XP_019422217.1 PREDICTED: increased DNA methylation 1-like isoform X2 [Lupinus angustifolius]XP_019422218.1 PREDICTED: increased DNA methylation 1-like isoform X2 [Lupinus angustifolius]XP_019422219.1 PREDICTED: increased DNA methylation 1-like isoform X2 [Lupinus angustifolius]XP_019422220.1 PREDICTED: increased DNA methylation 1-like isoform X2 [Lupinus angustifolius]XP_019422221.1 PREDICTED: increased DNA methy